MAEGRRNARQCAQGRYAPIVYGRARAASCIAAGIVLLLTSCTSSAVQAINEQAVLLNSVAAAQQEGPKLPFYRPRQVEYRIGAKDLLEIEVFELEEPNRSKKLRLRVGQAGNILLPLIGSVQARGRTVTQLQTAITRQLAAEFIHDPSVSVIVAEYKSRRVTVLGEVRYPGSFDLDQNSTTLVRALALAGGPTERAGGKLFVLRAAPSEEAPPSPGPEGSYPHTPATEDPAAFTAELGTTLERNLIQVDLEDLMERGNMTLNCELQDGDLVHVPKVPMCFVTGQVHYPGGFPLRHDVTILKAIALAGGARNTASPELTALVRMTEKGRITIPINLAELKAGSDQDLLMQPGDVLVLNQSTSSKVGRGLLEFFRGLFHVGYSIR